MIIQVRPRMLGGMEHKGLKTGLRNSIWKMKEKKDKREMDQEGTDNWDLLLNEIKDQDIE